MRSIHCPLVHTRARPVSKTVPAGGVVTFPFKVPNDFIGQHSVTVQGTNSGAPVSLNVPFTVVSATAGGGGAGGVGGTKSGGTLSRTGAGSTLPLGQAGIALLAAGGGAVYVAKRRRRVAPTA